MKTALEIITGLYLLSEALSFIPYFKANGTFQLFFDIVKTIYQLAKK